MADRTFRQWLDDKVAEKAIAMESTVVDLEDYDDAVRYPITTEEYAAEVGQKLDGDYHDAAQGWSDPCPQFCPEPACRQQCNGRDSSNHEEHSCGHHVWVMHGERVWRMWIQNGEKMYTDGTIGGPNTSR